MDNVPSYWLLHYITDKQNNHSFEVLNDNKDSSFTSHSVWIAAILVIIILPFNKWMIYWNHLVCLFVRLFITKFWALTWQINSNLVCDFIQMGPYINCFCCCSISTFCMSCVTMCLTYVSVITLKISIILHLYDS